MEDWYRPAETVDTLLRSRAEQGLFRAFASKRVRGRLNCTVGWLGGSAMEIVFDPRSSRLVFRDLLPEMPLRSSIYKDFQGFLRGRTVPEVPEHRRIDPARIVLKSTNSKGCVSVALASVDGDLEHLVSKGLKLVNEIFLGFLRGPYHEYMVRNFQEPED